MAGQEFNFTGASGNLLSGRIERPQSTARGWAIFTHCFTCGKDSIAAVRVARALALAGIGVLRFDFAGLGGSEGEFSNSTFASNVADLIAAAAAMTDSGHAPTLLVGHSLGGAAALAAAGEIDSVRAVVTIGAPASVEHVLDRFDQTALKRIEEEGQAELMLAGRPFTISRSFVDDAREQALSQRITQMKKPLLVMHAPHDEVVEIANATRIFLAAQHPKSFVSLDDADHLLTRRTDADYAAAVIAAWAARYLPKVESDLPDTSPGDGVVATETKAGPYQLEVRSGSHRIFADEPAAVGGNDSGMSPYELVAAGLAACTAMTMRMYANRKGIPLERASVRVTHSKQAGQTPADQFVRTLTLDGTLDEEQRQKLLSIADRCPVDLTLVRGSDVVTTLSEDPVG